MALTRIDSYLIDLDSIGGITFDDQAGTPTFKVDAVNHRVGIGISNPSSILNVGSKTLTSDADNQIILSGRKTGASGAYAGFYFKNSQDAGGSSASIRALREGDNYGTELALYTQIYGQGAGGDGAERLRVTSVGNVGIGTTSPSELLHVNGNALIEDRLLLQRLQSSDNLSVLTFSDTLTGSKGNNLSLGNPGGFDLLLHTGGVERARIDFSGNVGIGVTAPNSRLEISSSSGGGSSYSAIRLTSTSVGGASIDFGNSSTSDLGSVRLITEDAGSGVFDDGVLVFRTSADGTSNERMRITSRGNVGIGTTSPTSKLDVAGTVTATNFGDATGGYNVNLGSGGLEGRALVAGYSGGSYGGIGYNVRHTTTGGVFIAPIVDSSNYLLFNQGFTFLGETGGSAGRTVSYSALARLDNSGIFTQYAGGSYHRIANTSNSDSYSSTMWWNGLALGNNGDNFIVAGRNAVGGSLKFYVNNTDDIKTNTTPGGTLALTLASTGNVGIGTTSPLSKLDVRSGAITVGTLDATHGAELIRGYYSGGGALVVVGSEYSSGGPVIGACVKPSTSTHSAFLSSAGITGLTRGAYTIAGNVHKWYVGEVQTVAENSPVTMTEAMRINESRNLSIGTGVNAGKIQLPRGAYIGFSNAADTANSEYVYANGGNLELGVNGSTRLLINSVGAITISGAGNRPVLIDSNVNIKMDTGGWASQHGFIGSSDTNLGGFGAFGNANSLAYYWIGSAYNSPSVVVDSAGNAGIGTAAPLAKLHVQGTGLFTGLVGIGTTSPLKELQINATTPTIRLEENSGGSKRLEISIDSSALARIDATQSGSQLLFGTVGTERMRIDASGNVGIGTSAPLGTLSVGNHANTSGQLNDIYISGDRPNAPGYFARLMLRNSNQCGGSTASVRGEHSSDNYGTALTFYTQVAGGSSGGDGTERMRITNAGNIGIGITNPSSKLEVVGTVAASSGLRTLEQVRATGWWSTPTGSSYSGLGVEMGMSDGYGYVLCYNRDSGAWGNLRIQGSGGSTIIELPQSGSTINITGNTFTSGVVRTNGDKLVLRDDSLENHATNNDTAPVVVNYWGYAGGPTRFRDFDLYNGKAGLVLKAVGSSGNVGIGTTNPSTKLDVYGDIAVNGTFAIRRNNYGYSAIYKNVFIGSTDSISNTVSLCVDTSTISGGNFHGQNQVIVPRQGLLVPNQAGTNFIPVLSRDSNDYIRIGPDSSGGISSGPITVTTSNVGIGTTNPIDRLHVYGSNSSIVVANTSTGSAGVLIKYLNSETHGTNLLYNPSNAITYLDNTYPVSAGTVYGDIYFRQNVGGTMTERITIKGSNGNIRIAGETSVGQGRRLSLIGLDINSGGTPSYIKIRTSIPFASESADFTVNIKGFRYGGANTTDLSICWHYYNSTFYNATASSSGSWAPVIVLSAESGLVCITLYSPGYWPKLYVESMYSSSYNDTYCTGWSWVDASPTGTTVTVPYKSDFGNLFVMSSTGNVGIGTDSPLRKLDVRGDILVKNVSNGDGISAVMIGSSVPDGNLADTGVSIRTFVESAGANVYAMQFFTQQNYIIGQTEKMRISGAGDILINTSISSGNANSRGFRAGAAGELILLANSGGLFHQILSNYYLIQTTGGNTSDINLKKNINPISNPLDRVCAIRGVNFEFIGEPKDDASKGTQLGVIAQEVEQQFPEIVLEDQFGNKTVRYDRLVAPLIEAIKALREQNAQLEARIAALEV